MAILDDEVAQHNAVEKMVTAFDAVDAALEAIEESPEPPNIYRASSGVVLQLHKVAPMIVNDAGRRLKAPKPPMVQIEGKLHPEENPNDPDYLEAKERFEYDRGYLAVTVFLAMGTSPKEIPYGIAHLEDARWIEDLAEIVDLDIPQSGKRRYLAWLKYVALTSSDDVTNVMTKVMRLSNMVQEADVVAAVENFRDRAGVDADTPVRIATEDSAGVDDESSAPTSDSRN